MKPIIIIFFLYTTFFSFGQTVFFSENMGTPAGTTTIATNTFQNSGTCTYSGTADVRNNLVSSGYTGASGGGNVFVTNTVSTNFLISGINSSGYSSITMTLGHYKSTTAGNNELTIEVSSDGTTFTPLTYSRTTGSGTAIWTLVSPTGTIPSATNLRLRFTQTSTTTQFRIDDIKLTGTLIACAPQPTPTTNSSSLTASAFCTSVNLNWTSGNGAKRIVVMSTSPITASPVNNTNYASNSTFGSGSTIAAGNFVVFNGTGSSSTVTGLTANTTYFVKIFEYNLTVSNCNENYLTTAPASISFTTLNTCSTPQIRSILADACSLQEGLDELVIIENGNAPLSLNDIFLSFPSGGNYCNTTCGTNTLGNNATYINQLNTLAGCSLFTFANPIPAGAIIVVFTGQTPSYTFNYSTQCPSTAQYYAVFCNNTSTVGRFSNNDAAGVTRTMNATFAGTPEAVTYQPFLLTGDGSFVDFDNPGNPTYRNELNCVYPLGVELSNWTGSANNDESVLLSWSTLSEEDASHFEVFSVNPTDYSSEVVGSVFAKGNSTEKVDYQFIDLNPTKGVNYYQLNQVDRNGNSKLSSMLAVNISLDEQIISYSSGTLLFSKTLQESEEISIYSLDGKFIGKHIITEKTNSIQQHVSSGAFIVKIQKRNGQVNSLRSFASN